MYSTKKKDDIDLVGELELHSNCLKSAAKDELEAIDNDEWRDSFIENLPSFRSLIIERDTLRNNCYMLAEGNMKYKKEIEDLDLELRNVAEKNEMITNEYDSIEKSYQSMMNRLEPLSMYNRLLNQYEEVNEQSEKLSDEMVNIKFSNEKMKKYLDSRSILYRLRIKIDWFKQWINTKYNDSDAFNSHLNIAHPISNNNNHNNNNNNNIDYFNHLNEVNDSRNWEIINHQSIPYNGKNNNNNERINRNWIFKDF
ncbi:hypothetical protein SNEBB_004038 [Seison nebaliae]|nr:hypothetical protein SNEBB_004038 [Seison nebaliae]